MKRLVKITLLVLFLSVGLSSIQRVSASWAFSFVQWNDSTYKITNEQVTSVGREIGSVTKYSDIEGYYSGDFSNAVPVGTKYYEIPGIDTSKAIAIEKNGEYIKAEFIGHVSATNAAKRHTTSMEFNWNYIIIISPFMILFLLVLGMWFSSRYKRK